MSKNALQEWLTVSCELQPHALHPACVCFRCVWRRVHSRFWKALPVIAHCSMSDDDTYIQETDPFLGHQLRGQHCSGNLVYGSQLSQHQLSSQTSAIPDSYIDTSRVPLPSQPIASLPTGARTVHDRLKPIHARTFPNVHRCFNDKSRAIASISWEFCSAEEIWSIVTTKFLGAGRQETMAWFHNQTLKIVHELLTRFVALANDQGISNKVTTSQCRSSSVACSHSSVSGSLFFNNLPPRGLVTCSWKQCSNQDFSTASGLNCSSTTSKMKSKYSMGSLLTQPLSRLIRADWLHS